MGTEMPAVCSHGSLRRSCEICERDAEIERLRAERDEAIAAARHLKNLVTSPLTEEDKEWARETMSDTNLARMPRDLATILMAELLKEAAARIAELEAALDRIANVVGEDEPSIMWPWAQEIARSVLKESGS